MDTVIIINYYENAESNRTFTITGENWHKFKEVIDKGAEQLNLNIIFEDYAAKPTTSIDGI